MGEHGLYLFLGTVYGTFMIIGLIEEYERKYWNIKLRALDKLCGELMDLLSHPTLIKKHSAFDPNPRRTTVYPSEWFISQALNIELELAERITNKLKG